MKRIENIEDRADHLLQQIVKSGQRRDRLLEEVTALVQDTQGQQGSLDAIDEVRYRQLSQYVDRSAALAKTIESSASLAEGSSRSVKRLDALHSRVRATKGMVESMIRMKGTIAEMPATLATGDLDKTVALIMSYEQARRRLAARGVEEEEGEAGAAANSFTELTSSSFGAAATTTKTATASSSLLSAGQSSAYTPETDPLIAQARRDACEQLTAKAKAAMTVNDKLSIMKSAKLLSQLGLNREGMELYCNWMCNHTITALKSIVQRELHKMESPTEVAMSHLALVSQALDTVVAAYETEEEFTQETFGHEGPLLMLTLLHQRSTAECVPVLRNFIEKRKDALASLQRASKAAAAVAGRAGGRRRRGGVGGGGGGAPTGYNSHDSGSEGDGEDYDGDADLLLGSGGEGPAAAGAAAAANNATSGAADARRADQTLEETSHLVSCCHIYLDFAEAKRNEHVAALEKEHKAQLAAASSVDGTSLSPASNSPSRLPKQSAAVSAADRLWSDGGEGGSNALLAVVQEILSLYVPLQNSYFEAAFRQALQLQLQAIREGGGYTLAGVRNRAPSPSPAPAGRAGGSASSPTVQSLPIASPASFMAGITNMYATALGDAEDEARATAVAAAMEAETNYYLNGGAITLPDDVFFFLRIAVHRALNTKSTQIASAVIMSATDVVQSMLIAEIVKRAAVPARLAAALTSSSSGSNAPHSHHPPPPPPRSFRWACAGQQVAEYSRKLAQELRITTGSNSSSNSTNSGGAGGDTAHFSSRDVVRFRELAQDLDIAANDLTKMLAAWMAQDAALCVGYIKATSGHLERFAAISYDISEEVFYHYELNDPWVQALLVDWAELLDYVAAHLLDATLFDLLLVNVATAVSQATRQAALKKQFSTFGALQVDKDVRALREFFFQCAHEVSTLREVFAPLSLTSTLLLCDAPRDALEEAHNMALTAEEKRSVLLLRVDFKRQDVLALRL